MLEFETELSNLMSILKDDHKEYLEVNDDVIHKGTWGTEPPRVAKVTAIQKFEDEGTNKYINKISWKDFHANQREYVVDLHDCKWAYNFQINPL
tara:strand:- start:2892 stop:3173 length:282 start_codon:yes stop_codon:yes gene_type:complete